MDIKLNPKYEVGQKIVRKIFTDNGLLESKEYIINNIHVIYDFKTKEIFYKYQLKTDDEFGFIDSWHECE